MCPFLVWMVEHMFRRSMHVQAEGDYTDVPNSQIRRITAQRLLESKTTIPHYYLTIDVNADRLVKLRAQLNEALAPSGAKLSLNDFVIKATALVRSLFFYRSFELL